MQQIATNTKMKHQNKPLPAIFPKYHVNTWKVCFPIGSFVSMLTIYKVMTKFGLNWVKLMQLFNNRPVLTSEFDVRKQQKQFRSVIQIHLD